MEVIVDLGLRLLEMMSIKTSTKCIEVDLGWQEKKKRERMSVNRLFKKTDFEEEMNGELEMRDEMR